MTRLCLALRRGLSRLLALPATLIALVALVILPAAPALAASGETHETWGDMAATMSAVLDDAYDTYLTGDLEGGRDGVNDAYYGYYEAGGFEKTVMAYVAGQAAVDAEYEFGVIKKLMLAGGPDAQVKEHTDTLKAMLVEQAAQLDGDEASTLGTFLKALAIILREGVEAMLVVAAIIAYLKKAGAARRVPLVWAGAVLAVVASFALAFAINAVTALAGASQEVIEGVTVLLACAMLIWVSVWMAGKSGGHGLVGKLTGTEAGGARAAWGLAGVAFLAVFREGAEVILLVQALKSGSQGAEGGIWLGLAVGAVALVAVYLVIRLASIRLPLRPFFLATSALLALLAISFAGSGIRELQEGDVFPMTPLPGLPAVDWLGFYPTIQTLAAQVLVTLLLAVGLYRALAVTRAKTAAATETIQAEPA